MRTLCSACYASFVLAMVASSTAWADCEAALVKSTYVSSSAVSQRSELADLVEESTYNDLKRDASANAIYGIPMGVSYGDFRRNVENYKRRHHESYSKSELVNIAWAGLDSGSPDAYRTCLDHQVLMSDGLRAAVIAASSSDIVILVRWNVPGNDKPAEVSWSPSTIGDVTIPTTIPDGSRTIRIPRPAQSLNLTGNYAGYTTAAILLEPMLPPPAPVESLAPTSIDFDGDGSVDSFSLDMRGFTVRLASGASVKTYVNDDFDSFVAGDAQWAAGDFNRDGYTDVAVVVAWDSPRGYLHVFRSNGDGTFGDGNQPTAPFQFAIHAQNADNVYDARGVWTAEPRGGSGGWALKHTPIPGRHDPNICAYYWTPKEPFGTFELSGQPCP